MSRSPRAIEKAVAMAVNQADWLRPSDQATVRLAKRLAETLDNLYEADPGQLFSLEAQLDVAGKVAYTSQTLLRALNDLGLTPANRPAETDSGESKLEQLRATVTSIVPK